MWRQDKAKTEKKDVNRRNKFTEGINLIVVNVMYPVEKRKDRKKKTEWKV